jgi:hypothetical protein
MRVRIRMETKLARIAEIDKTDSIMKFTSLAHLLNQEALEQCYHDSNKQKCHWNRYGRTKGRGGRPLFQAVYYRLLETELTLLGNYVHLEGWALFF